MVFFVAWTFNGDTLKRGLTFTTQGIFSFRRGLDISGGTKLTYRVDYSKYEEAYKDSLELKAVQNTVQNIIVQNIDGRISKLGVSDYKSYTQQLNNETQIVVEIGGVADLDQAKEIIGKTVELEFKLPNEATDDTGARATLAKKYYQDISANPEKMAELTEWKTSDDVYYNRYDAVSLAQLPTFYRNNAKLVNSLASSGEKLSDIIEWIYGDAASYDEEGNQTLVPVEGFTFFRVLDKTTQERTGSTIQDVIEVLAQMWVKYDEKINLQNSDMGIASGNYKFIDGVLWFNNWEFGSGQDMLDVRVLAVAPESTLGKSVEETKPANQDLLEKITNIKTELAQDLTANIQGTTELLNWWIGMPELQQAIPSFDPTATDIVQSYEGEDGVFYVLVINDTKTVNERKYSFLKVAWVNESAFSSALKTLVLYTIEDLFVKDHLTWLTAQTSDGKILNGANFKYAGITTSQLWKPVVVLNFDDQGKEIFCNITENHIGKQMAIFIWGKMITSPVIQAKICDGAAQIDGSFTPASAKELASSLNDGALPAPLILMQEEKVSPTLGDSAFSGAVLALSAGLLMIWIYMTVKYGFKKGLLSLISLVSYLIVLLAIVKLIDYALSLSGIAAIILSIGMAVDTNVLILERLKEEKAEGKTDEVAIKTSYERSRIAIKDAQLSTWLIGLLLFVMGINMFKGFGAMLIVGVILTLLVNVPLIRELLYLFYPIKRKK